MAGEPIPTSSKTANPGPFAGAAATIDVKLEPRPSSPKVLASVGGTPIDESHVRAEVQYHPAPSLAVALHEALRALVVRQLLLHAAVADGLLRPAELGDERIEQGAIDELTAKYVPVPPPSEAQERQFYDAHPARFVGHELYDASHILLAAPSAEAAKAGSAAESARAESRAKGEELLLQVLRAPGRFEHLAETHSVCPSGKQGGRLGQLSHGETLPPFESALSDLESGETCARLVETHHGFHIVRLNFKADRLRLPFEAVQERIRIYLRDRAWRAALHEYVADLGLKLGVEGFDLASSAPALPVEAPAKALTPAAPVQGPSPRRLRVLS